jgi:deoxyribonuclease V
VIASNPSFMQVTAETAVLVEQALPCEPGQFSRRELPAIQAVLSGVARLGLLLVDGYADLDPSGRMGLGAHAHAAPFPA